MSNGYLVAADADLAAAHDIGDGFGLDVIDASAVGDREAVAAALARAANVGVLVSDAAARSEAFVTLLRLLTTQLANAQLIVIEDSARAALPFLPAAWPVMPLDEARRRADEAGRRRRQEQSASGGAAPVEEPPAEEPPAPPPQAEPEPEPEAIAPPTEEEDAPLARAEPEPKPDAAPSIEEEAPPLDEREEAQTLDDLVAIEPGAGEVIEERAADTDAPGLDNELPAPLDEAPGEPETEDAPVFGGGVPHEEPAHEQAPDEQSLGQDQLEQRQQQQEEFAPEPSVQPQPAAPPPATATPPPAAAAPMPEPPRGAPPPQAPAKKTVEALRRTRAVAQSPADATAFAPKRLRRATPELVRIVIHQPQDLKEVIKAAKKIDERTEAAPQGMNIGDVAHGAGISVALDVTGGVCEGAQQRRIWKGDPLDFNFSVVADDVAQVVIMARVMVDDAQIGVLAFTRKVMKPREKPAGAGDKARLKRHRRVFLSYSSEDREIVSVIATAYDRAGVAHFWDRTSLSSGEEWSPRLQREIDRCDLFHLCWSKSAASSEWVAKEAEHALTRRHRSKRPDITVQMLDGPPWAPHPRELDSINFDDFVRAAIVGYARGDGS